MDSRYDVFQIYPDHSIRWRVCVVGRQETLVELEALTNETVNKYFATDVGTQEIVGHVHEGRAQERILDDGGGAN